MTRRYETTTHEVDRVWRKYPDIGGDKALSGTLAGHNGNSTPFGLIYGGTLMALDGNSKYRPMGAQGLDAAIAAANIAKVTDSNGFYVGDEVDFFAGADAYAEATVVADATAKTFVVTALQPGSDGNRIDIKLTDPSGNDEVLAVIITDDLTDLLIDVSLATGGAGAISSTIAEVIAAINSACTPMGLASAALLTAVGTETCIAVAKGDLAGGQLIGDELVSDRTITLIDRTTTPHEITFGGAAVDLALGDMVANATTCYGILSRNADTAEKVGSALVAKDRPVKVALEAVPTSANVAGYDADLVPYLMGGYATGKLGVTNGWPIFGFRFDL